MSLLISVLLVNAQSSPRLSVKPSTYGISLKGLASFRLGFTTYLPQTNHSGIEKVNSKPNSALNMSSPPFNVQKK